MSVAALKSNNATCHSVEMMSTCTPVASPHNTVNKCSSVQSVKSMSLCSSAEDTKPEETPNARQSDVNSGLMGSQQPANSTFGDGSHLEFQDIVPHDLSAINGRACTLLILTM